MHALIKNGSVEQYPYGFWQLKAANPLTSFPAQATDELLASFGVQRVFSSTPPAITDTQVLEEWTPVIVDGRWTQFWAVRDLTSEEVASRNDAKAVEVRSERNAKLLESDWTQVADAPVDKAAWASYRQALRDVSSQTGFPNSVAWPSPPTV
jgi:hypothetical protein